MKTTAAETSKDDGLEWLREIRRQISAESNHDPRLIGQKLRELEKQYADRMFRTRMVVEPVAE